MFTFLCHMEQVWKSTPMCVVMLQLKVKGQNLNYPNIEGMCSGIEENCGIDLNLVKYFATKSKFILFSFLQDIEISSDDELDAYIEDLVTKGE